MSKLVDRVRELSMRPVHVPGGTQTVPVSRRSMLGTPALTDDQWRNARLWSKSDGRCFYCVRETDVKDRQVDHIVPRHGRRGMDAEWNLVPACRSCNASKGDTRATEWVRGWLLYRLRRAGWAKESAIEYRDKVYAFVESVESYHVYLMSLARGETSTI